MYLESAEGTNAPIYQQIVDLFIHNIQSGAYRPGIKLPTVRDFARDNSMSQGTVKHAYDILEQLGYIEKCQGRGTFVSEAHNGAVASKKDQAMAAIDSLLDQLTELSFSMREIRIFLDLKLRERESLVKNVRVAAVDCSPEAISVMNQQISSMKHVDVYGYLLPTVLDAPHKFSPDADIVLTTPKHFDDLSGKLVDDSNLIRLVMGISRKTLLELARIPAEYQIGILCASERFAQIIAQTCQKYGVLGFPPKIAYFGNADEVYRLIQECDQIILPPNHLKFASPQELDLIGESNFRQPPIIFQYQIEKGSLLYLEEQIEKVYLNYQSKL